MQKKFLILPLIALLFACGGEPTNTTVIFNVKNYNAEQISLAWDADGEYKYAQVDIVDGKGEWIDSIPEGTAVSMFSLDPRNQIEVDDLGVIPGPSLNFYIERGKILISFDSDEWPIASIKGGKLSAEVNEYWAIVAPLYKAGFEANRRTEESGDTDMSEWNEIRKRTTEANINFVKSHVDSPLSLDVLAGLKMDMSLEEFEACFNNFSERIKESDEGIKVAAEIASKKKLMAGNPAPLFSKTDKDGVKRSLEDYRGKYVLIDFWGTWCVPCRESHPHLVELYKKYAHQGIEFINVALEHRDDWRDNWLKAIEDDGLVWTNIADNEFPSEGNMVELFQIDAFPTKILIDREGKLLARFVGDTEGLDEKLAELFPM